MADYIKRQDTIDPFLVGKNTFAGFCTIEQAIENIESVEAADVVEVVRCKDCKYWQDNNGGYPHEDCRWGKGETPDAYDYCSFGERKDG